MRRFGIALSLVLVIADVMPVAAADPPANAPGKPIRLGVLADMSSAYATHGGKFSVRVARMAAEDVGGQVAGRPIEIISADSQNKPDVAATTARTWLDVDGVDAILDVAGTPNALAVSRIAAERNKVTLISGAVTSDLTGKDCTPTSSQWIADTYVTASAVVPTLTAPGDKWAFITVDNVGGKNILMNATNAVGRAGGVVVSTSFHPLNTADFSSYLLTAQASGANIIGFANAGSDAVNSVKQAHEFGLNDRIKLVGIPMGLSDINGIGLETAHGMYTAFNFYWDRNAKTRAWAKRFFDAEGVMPDYYQAGLYQGVRSYLAAVEKTGSTDGGIVSAAMRSMPMQSDLFDNARLRPNGQFESDIYVVKVKSPAESHYANDDFIMTATVPAATAFEPLALSACPLINGAAHAAK